MRINPSRSRLKTVMPAPLAQRRRSKRRYSSSRGSRPVQVQPYELSRTRIDPTQWLAFAAIGLISVTLIALIWTVTSRTIEDQARDVRARTDQQVSSVAFVLAREIQDELLLVDQSLAIVQDDWNNNPEKVDLEAWRHRLLALTSVANDIFIANEHDVIVQGTLPRSIGQGFGSAYVIYENGSLENFNPDGIKNPEGKVPGVRGIEARQFLTYLVRKLATPPGWMVGASYRSEGITKLFAGAQLGDNGLVGLVSIARGALQAIVGQSAQFANMDISRSDLAEQMRKNDFGLWAGVSPIDNMPRVIAYQRVPNRDMAVMVGIATETALQPLSGLAAMARGVATVGSLVVLTIAGILVWTIATTRVVQRRQRAHERSEINLGNARQELQVVRARALLNEPEAGALLGSPVDGVARLDGDLRLRRWNARFAELAGVTLDPLTANMPVEDLFRRQAAAGVFGDQAEAERAIATRLAILHNSGTDAQPLMHRDPGGELVTMHVRGLTDHGHLLLWVASEAERYVAPVPAEAEPETADEITEW